MTACWERGRPARHNDGFPGARASRPHQAWHSLGCLPQQGSSGNNGPCALLQPGRGCSRRQGGCLQHRTEAQRQPKGQDAGGTPALPGDAVPVVQWRVPGGRLLRMPTCTLWETPVCPRAGPPPCREDHSRQNGRSLVKMNHKWTRINTNRPEDRWTSFNDKRRQNASAILCPECDFVSLVDNSLNWSQTSQTPAPHDGADHSRVKQVLFQASRAPAPRDGTDHTGRNRGVSDRTSGGFREQASAL